MTTDTLHRDILANIADTRRVVEQARLEGAALRGELGVRAQLTAMSQRYNDLRAAGKVEEAAAVKAEAFAIWQANQ
jgi:hypothetical protein